MDRIIIYDVDITHYRLVDLFNLADQAKPFYDWIEKQFQELFSLTLSLEEILWLCDHEALANGIRYCYRAEKSADLPLLFDGIGRPYDHKRACFYFFSWLIRDAPQQRLRPLIQQITANSGGSSLEVEIRVVSSLIYNYRENVKNFSWPAIREVIVDRLEGSRRSIKGHAKETIVRTAVITAIQSYYGTHGNYGIYGGVELSKGQEKIGNQTYDVSVDLLDKSKKKVRKILVPVKTRETEGGGHSHLFSRDILSAISEARREDANNFIVVIIIARNWSNREAEGLRNIVDHLVTLNISPGSFEELPEDEQIKLNEFFSQVLNGGINPRG